MNISTIEAYVAQKNKWTAIFKGRQVSLLNKADRQSIANSLDADLSPENLTCDGELPRAEVARRYKTLTKAAQELVQLDPTVKIYEFYTGE
jgi:hypothetical protein